MNNNINSWVDYGVTDFANPLAKNVDEKKRQIEQDYQNKIAQSKQIEEADSNVQALEMVGGILDFGTTLAKYAKQTKDARKEKADAKTSDTLERYASDPVGEDAVAAVLRYQAGKHEIKKSSEGFEKLIKSLEAKGTDPKLLDYLRKANPREIVRIREVTGNNYIKNKAKLNYQDYVEKLKPEERLKYEQNIAGNPGAIKKSFYDFIEKELDEKLGLSKDLLIGTGMFDELKAQAETLAGLGSAAYNVQSLTERGVNFQNDIDLAGTQSNKNINAYAQTAQDHTLKDGDKELTFARYILAGSKGDLQSHEVAGMRNGYIEHPSGTIVVKKDDQYNKMGFEVGAKLAKGEILFKPEQWARLNKVINESNAKAVNNAATIRDTALINATGMASKGQLTQTQRAAALQAYEEAGGDTTKQIYKDLVNLNLPAQTTNYYEAEKAEIMTSLRNGNLESVMENIDQIQNTKLRNEMKAKKKQYETALTNTRNEKGFGAAATKDLKKAFFKTLKPGESVPAGTPTTAYNYIANKRQRIFTEEFWLSDPNDPTLGTRIEQRVTAELTAEGLYANPGSNEGPLTPTISGEFPGIAAFMEAQLEKTSGSSTAVTLAESTRMWSRLSGPGKNKKDRLLNTKGAVLSNGEIVAVAQFGWDGDKFTGYPKDVLLKAELLGVQPSVLLRRQINALLGGDKDDKALAELYNLKGLAEKLQDAPDVKLRQIIENSEDKDLLNYYEKIGLNNFGPKQLQKLIEIEKNIDAQDLKVRQQRVKDLDNKRNVSKALEDFNRVAKNQPDIFKNYPDGITRKDIEWDKETNTWILKKVKKAN
tara:strand:- start:1972 stop:4431 length:2460 start_codon:yes stop_codon:yes gene_type:complete